jgi:Rod binding domain-containing protein
MTSLPPIDQSLLPADIRNAGKDDKANYTTALAFERELVEQLTQQLADTSGLGSGDDATASGDDSGDDAGQSAATSSYQQMLPGVLADSIMANGGLGLARQIAQNLKEKSA